LALLAGRAADLAKTYERLEESAFRHSKRLSGLERARSRRCWPRTQGGRIAALFGRPRTLDSGVWGRHLKLGAIRRAFPGMPGGRADKLAEERLGTVGARVELRVVLGGDEERVVGKLDHLDQALVGGGAAADQALVFEPATQLVVDLVTVAVALVDDRL